MSPLDQTRYGSAVVVIAAPNRLAANRTSVPEVPADALTFAREFLNFDPDPKQAEILASRANSGIINCSRQWGKSTLMAILSVHRALVKPNSLILHVGPTQRQSGELLEKARHFLWQINVRYRTDGRNSQSACLPNGSRIVALPAAPNRVRGFSGPTMIVIDEAAQVSDDLYHSVKPMLLPNAGDLWLVSTPYGQRGFFWEEWKSDNPDWVRFAVRASECPRFDPAQLERQKRGFTEKYYRQEFECEFVDPDDALFPRELLLRALTDDEWSVSL